MEVDANDAALYIDPAYPGPWCVQDIVDRLTGHESEFLDDSVTSPDANLSYPSTNVWFLYGGGDNSSASNQGENYRSQIRTSTSAGCVSDAPHSIPDALDGAERIASDIISQCRARRRSK